MPSPECSWDANTVQSEINERPSQLQDCSLIPSPSEQRDRPTEKSRPWAQTVLLCPGWGASQDVGPAVPTLRKPWALREHTPDLSLLSLHSPHCWLLRVLHPLKATWHLCTSDGMMWEMQALGLKSGFEYRFTYKPGDPGQITEPWFPYLENGEPQEAVGQMKRDKMGTHLERRLVLKTQSSGLSSVGTA